MKRHIFLTSFCFLFLHFNIHAEFKISDSYDYNNLVLSINKVSEPEITEDAIIFTQENIYRVAGLCFDFEDFKTIHPYQIRKSEDIDGKVTNSIMFFVLEKPENIENIAYKVILDGLWTVDPTNKNTVYDSRTGLTLSTLSIPKKETNLTEYKKDDRIRFVYNGEPGQTVRLAGNFTNWDSWIYTLEEKRPGFYELSLHLPEGTYYYNYYSGFSSFQDKTNPEKVYTDDGRVLSVIKVQ